MSQHVALFTVGFVLLALGALLLAWGVGQLARRFGASPWAIGMVVVPFAVADPVLAVTVNSSLGQRDTLTLGMILGSTVVNVAFALGTAALLRPLAGSSPFVTAAISVQLVAVLGFWFVCRDNSVSRIDAVILISGFVAAVAYLGWVAKDEPAEVKAAFTDWQFGRWPPAIAAIVAIIGTAAVIGGAYLLVPEAVEIARMQPRTSTKLFGTIAVVLASSLALLCVVEVAARNGHADLAIGTVVVANLCNLLLAPAIAAFISPFGVSGPMLMNDLPAAALVTFLLLGSYLNGLRIGRSEGVVLVVAFVAYVAWQITRK